MPCDSPGITYVRTLLCPWPSSPFRAAMKVKDPVCGMTIDSERAAAQGTYDGKVVYFCAKACQATFEARRKSG